MRVRVWMVLTVSTSRGNISVPDVQEYWREGGFNIERKRMSTWCRKGIYLVYVHCYPEVVEYGYSNDVESSSVPPPKYQCNFGISRKPVELLWGRYMF